jgi:hypothetical protein
LLFVHSLQGSFVVIESDCVTQVIIFSSAIRNRRSVDLCASTFEISDSIINSADFRALSNLFDNTP